MLNKKQISSVLTLASAVCLLNSCAPPYEKYMREGADFELKGKYPQAKESYHKAVGEARKLKKAEKGEPKLLAALVAEAALARMTKEDDAAVRIWTEAIEIAEKSKDFQRAAKLRKNIGDLLVLNGNNHDAEISYKEGLKDLDQGGELKSEIGGAILMALGDLKIAKKDNRGALALMEKANTTLDGITGRDLHLHADVLHKLSFIYQELNRENDAIECEERAKKIEMSGIGGRVQTLKGITER